MGQAVCGVVGETLFYCVIYVTHGVLDSPWPMGRRQDIFQM